MKYRFIDITKTIGIFLVIFAHTLNVDVLTFRFIYTFHMPLFFILSGFLYNSQKYQLMSFKEFSKYKLTKYIRPYFIYISIFYIIYIVIINFFEFGLTDEYYLQAGKKFLGSIYSFGSQEYMPRCSPLWFLTFLFSLELLFYFFDKVKKISFKISIVIIFVLLGTYFSHKGVKLFWNLDVAFAAFPFFVFGYYFRKRNIYKSNLWFLLIPITAFAYYRFFTIDFIVNFDPNIYSNIKIMYLLAFSFCIPFICLIQKLDFIYSPFFSFISKNTIHIFALDYSTNYLIRNLNNNFWVQLILKILILSIFIFCINLFKKKILVNHL